MYLGRFATGPKIYGGPRAELDADALGSRPASLGLVDGACGWRRRQRHHRAVVFLSTDGDSRAARTAARRCADHRSSAS